MRHLLFSGFTFLLFFCLLSCEETPKDAAQGAPTENWISLFNGKDLTGWTGKISDKDLNSNWQNTWLVEDSMIRINYMEYDSFRNDFGHLYYEQPYSSYKLRFEYRFTGEQVPGGSSWNVRNSGVMLHSQSAESNDYGQWFPVSVELQLLGGLSDGKERTTGNVCTPGTAVAMGDTINYNHCISSSSKTYDGDQWVKAEAVVLAGEAMHFLIEGDTVLSFQQPQIGGGMISKAQKGKDWDQFKVVEDKADWIARDGEILTGGYIALQAESHPIDFRKIELLELE